jgi:hypothetical protein
VEGTGATEEKTNKTSARISGVPVEIRTDHLLNTSQQKLSLEPTFSIARHLFIYGLFIDAVSNSDSTASNGRVIKEWLIAEGVEGSGCDVF